MRPYRSRKPATAATVSMEDIRTAYVWGLTLTDWYNLPDTVRADRRRNITQAPRFGEQ